MQKRQRNQSVASIEVSQTTCEGGGGGGAVGGGRLGGLRGGALEGLVTVTVPGPARGERC